jgi:hypothetical protein
LKDDGFLPTPGLFPAVLGEIVAECQFVHGMKMDDMELGLNSISTAFVRHKFDLRVNDTLSVMELVIKVDSTLLITARVLKLIRRAVAKVMPNLRYTLAINQDGGGCPAGVVLQPQGHLVIIDGEGGIQQKIKDDERDISLGPGDTRPAIQAQKRFEKWLLPRGLREEYDIFISYRWTVRESGGMDTELVDSMFQAFCHELVEQRQVHVFVDRNRLEDGRNFKTDFSQAVMHSTVLVLIVSKAALHKMLRLQEDSEDNVLFEWTMVAELLEIRALDFCLPVMIGEVSDDTAS